MASEPTIPGLPGPPAGIDARVSRGESGVARANPEALMAEVNRPRMARMLAIAVIFHALLMGLTSTRYLADAYRYRTLHPKWKLRQLAKDEAEKQAAADLAKATEEARKRMAGTARKGPGGRESAEPGPESRSGGEPGKKAGDKKSGIEKAITETSKERPSDSSLNLDDALR